MIIEWIYNMLILFREISFYYVQFTNIYKYKYYRGQKIENSENKRYNDYVDNLYDP
jgi:hypothetical protein